MKKLILIFLSIMFSINCFAHAHTHSSIVLVHGALLTSNVWAPVQSYLQNSGYNVITIDTPGRVNDGVQPNEATLIAATEKVCKVIKMQNEPVLLVGHSQAGAIISQAITYCSSHIKGLVYVAAVMPLSGEKAFDLLSEKDNHNFDIAAPIDNNRGVAQPNYNAPIKELFMDDANEIDAKRAINDMVPEPIILGEAVLNYDADLFNRIPRFYIKTLKDQIISPETQDKYIKRQKIREVFVLNTAHSPFVSQPHMLAHTLALINDSL